MKVLIAYDSVYGDTERIAKAIGGAITGEVKVLRVDEANPSELERIGLFIVGSPTQGGRPTPAIRDLLNKVPEASLQGIKVSMWLRSIPESRRNLLGSLDMPLDASPAT